MTNKRESRLALDYQIHRRHLKAKIEVTGNDADIKREFERIEQAERRIPKTIAQTKTPSAVTDGG